MSSARSASATAEIELRAYRPGDETGILACYNRIFPDPEHGIPARSAAHWRWKFAANPTGQIQHVVAEHPEHGIVGGYAGIPVAIRAEGRTQLAAQGVDLMVLPEFRRAGRRPGLLAWLGWKYHELYCGAGEGKVLFTYGWPVPAWRMGQRYLGYWNIRDWDIVFREVEGTAPRPAPAELAVAEVERFGPDVDALWARLEPGIELGLIRDARYLSWRYGERPDRSYSLYECRERGSGALRGVCVYGVGDVQRPRTGFLVDWLAPADDHDATVAMVAALEQRVRVDGVGVLGSVWNHVDPRFLTFQRLGFLVLGTPYFLVLASFKYETSYYRDHWYLTMGDSDLI